jgi:hypothetical protein
VSGYAQAGVPDQDVVEQSFADEQASGLAAGSAAAASSLPGDSVAAAASTDARARLGLLEVSASSTATGGAFFQFPPPGASASGVANPVLLFEDTIRVLAPDPSLSFLPGTLVFRLHLDAASTAASGAAPVGNGGRVEHVLGVGLGRCLGCFDGSSGILSVSASGATLEGPQPPYVFETRPMEFLFDQFATLEVSLSAIATATATSADPQGVSSAGFVGELRWGGVAELRAGAGGGGAGGGSASLPCAIESASGIDWCQPVPEAAGGGAAGVALAGIAAARARRLRERR